ncbi:MAG: LamG domain-containing protein, partial [Candidatus Bathyarchaeia archaeon]
DSNSTPAENVWDSNFVFVSHMQDNPDNAHIRDSTQNNNDGTKTGATGGPTFTMSGCVDGAQSFLDENNDTVECNDSASLDSTDAITIEAWVKPTISALREMFIKGLYWGDEAYEFYQNGSQVNWRLNNNAISKTSTNSLTINAWNYIVATYDKNLAYDNMKIFIAGVQDPTTGNYTAAILMNNYPFVIGAYPSSYTGYRYPFEGYIDEVRISNVARSATWIKASYESERDDLIAYGNEEEGANYDGALRIVNQTADNWEINLKIYNSTNLSRISSLNISLHDGVSSDQIAISGGFIIKCEGEQCDLQGGSGSTIYISVDNIRANISGASYLYVYLKIQVPSKYTYLLYIITFEIT